MQFLTSVGKDKKNQMKHTLAERGETFEENANYKTKEKLFINI